MVAALVSEFGHEVDSGSTVSPAIVEQRKLVLVIDGAPMVHHDAGRAFNFANVAAMQFWCMGRKPDQVAVPTVLVRDECSWNMAASLDAMTQAVSRGQKLASISATQNLPILTSGLGGNDKARMEAQAFAAMHNSLYFFSNVCPETGEFAEKIIGLEPRIMTGGSTGQCQQDDWVARALGATGNYNWHEQMLPRFPGHKLAELGVGQCVEVSQGNFRILNLYQGKS